MINITRNSIVYNIHTVTFTVNKSNIFFENKTSSFYFYSSPILNKNNRPTTGQLYPRGVK